MELIENEVTIQSLFSSKNIVKIKKLIEGPEKFYIFMDYCNGGDLLELLKAKNWEFEPEIVHKITK